MSYVIITSDNNMSIYKSHKVTPKLINIYIYFIFIFILQTNKLFGVLRQKVYIKQYTGLCTFFRLLQNLSYSDISDVSQYQCIWHSDSNLRYLLHTSL